MKQYSDTISVELTFDEIAKTVTRAVIMADEIIEDGSPLRLLAGYVALAKKLNDILKQNGFDHYTDEKFQRFDEFIQINKLNNI